VIILGVLILVAGRVVLLRGGHHSIGLLINVIIVIHSVGLMVFIVVVVVPRVERVID
jgi:hypothetical protein